MKIKQIIILASASFLILIATGYLVNGYMDSVRPPNLEVLSVRLTGSGDLIDVRYSVDKPIKQELNGSNVYLMSHLTGKKYGVAGVVKIGMLLSRSPDSSYGWFFINNADKSLVKDSWVTVVIGDYRQEMLVEGMD